MRVYEDTIILSLVESNFSLHSTGRPQAVFIIIIVLAPIVCVVCNGLVGRHLCGTFMPEVFSD